MTAERYQKETRLSRDDRGTTWRARDTRTGFSVAVKEMTPGASDKHASGLSDALREATRSLQDLKHAGLPTLLDHYEEDGTYGWVCEWVEGRPLQSHVEEASPLSPDDALRVLQDGLEILAHLHSHDTPVLHGDLHPGNLIVDGAGKLHIVGFPGVDIGSDVARRGSCAAPEVTRGQACPGSDLYALGLSLCAAVTGTAVDQIPCVPGWGGKRLVLDRALSPSPLRDVLQSLVEPDLRRRPGTADEAIGLVESAREREALLQVAEVRTSEARKRVSTRTDLPKIQADVTSGGEDTGRAPASAPSLEADGTSEASDGTDDLELPAQGSPPWTLMAVTALMVGLAIFVYQGDEPSQSTPENLEQPEAPSPSEAGTTSPETTTPTAAPAEAPKVDLASRCAHLKDSGGLGAWSQLLRDAPDAPCAPEAHAAILSGLDRPAVRTVSPGSVVMGARDSDTETLWVASLTRGYDFSTTEVTRHLYRQVLNKGEGGDGDCPLCPVDNVSWTDAIAFANALSRREGLDPAYVIEGEGVTWDVAAKGYRLPTNAEWERAAHGLSWPEDKGESESGLVSTSSMQGGVAEWVWDSFAEASGRPASKKHRVKWKPSTDAKNSPEPPDHHPDCLPGGALAGPDFPGGPGFASSVSGQEASRAPLGKKRAIAVEAPGPSDVGAVVTIRHGRTDKLRRRLTGHTNTQVFARALQSAWILSYAVDGELRLWDPRKGQEVASDRYIGGDLSPQGVPGGRIYISQAGKGKIAVMSPRFLTVWHWGRKNPRAKPFLDLVPPAWDPAVLGGILSGPDGRLASVKGAAVTVWDDRGKELGKLETHQGSVRGAQTVSGDLLATWSDDQRIHLWSWAGDPRATLVGHESPIVCLEDLGKGRVISRDSSGRAVLWDTRQGQALGVLGPLVDGDDTLVARTGVKAFKAQMKRPAVDPAPNEASTDRTIRGSRDAPPGARDRAAPDTRRAGLGFRLVRSR